MHLPIDLLKTLCPRSTINFANWPSPHFVKSDIPRELAEFIKKLKAKGQVVDKKEAERAKAEAKRAARSSKRKWSGSSE